MVSYYCSLSTNNVSSVFPRSLAPRSLAPLQRNSSRIALRNPFRLTKTLKCVVGDQIIARRSGNYQPAIWKNDYIESIKNEYSGAVYEERAAKLKECLKQKLENVEDPLDKLEMIDDLERLGISYHFEDEIKIILKETYNNNMWSNEDLFATSLRFRILRQHGYKCSSDVFNNFKDGEGNFKTCLCKDTKGLLYLYDAAFLSVKGDTLEEAREFSAKYLKEGLEKKEIAADLATLVTHSLELPRHWRMQRLEARWFIDVYRRRSDMNPIILEFAIIDFNITQAIHQEDLKEMSRWSRSTGFGEKLSFARDRLVENLLCSVGVHFEPKFKYFRRMTTKVSTLISTMDDVYDIYGTLEELELFTSAVERWDLSLMDQLPDYMKICYYALFNTTNEIAYDILKEEGLLIICYLKKAWVDLCKIYLLEAKWYHSGYKPTFDEYMNNSWISVAAPVFFVHSYISVTKPLVKENLKFLEEYHNIIKWSSMILRLLDDLVTSSEEIKRGDVPKSVQCYMHETGASKEEALKHIKHLIDEMWMDINNQIISEESSSISENFTGIIINMVRMGQCMYRITDGHNSQDPEARNRILSLIMNPIPLLEAELVHKASIGKEIE